MSQPNGQKTHHRYVVLVLQGGGALGAYHAGAFRAMVEAGYTPQWVAGVSIGAVNAALIAGNPPAQQLATLEEFWEIIIRPSPWDKLVPESLLKLYNTGNALQGVMLGQPNFSVPFYINPYLAPPGTPPALALYDNSPLRNTLDRMVDFERLKQGTPRLSLGVTKVRTGDVLYFDNTRSEHGPITAEHVIASSSIPPFYGGVHIDGELYWDGGIVDNTPLEPVLEDQDAHPDRDTLVFMVDLWDGSGPEPRTLDEAMWRLNAIQFASRTERHIQQMIERENLKRRLATVTSGTPTFPDGTTFSYGNLDIVRVNYIPDEDQTSLSYLDFSRLSINERREAGYRDMKLALDAAPWSARAGVLGSRGIDEAAAPVPNAAMHTIKRGTIETTTPGADT
jgi:NTE family protein